MHTYRESNIGWEVGYYRMVVPGDDPWTTLEDFKKKEDAVAYVNYLNGGTGVNPYIR